MIAWVSFHADSGQTMIIGTKRALIDTIQQTGDQWFIIFRHAELVGWIICWKQSVEETVEFAPAYETDITDLYGLIRIPWIWLPQELFAEDVVMGHLGPRGSRKNPVWEEVRDVVEV
jgi:hypothetical protein